MGIILVQYVVMDITRFLCVTREAKFSLTHEHRSGQKHELQLHLCNHELFSNCLLCCYGYVNGEMYSYGY